MTSLPYLSFQAVLTLIAYASADSASHRQADSLHLHACSPSNETCPVTLDGTDAVSFIQHSVNHWSHSIGKAKTVSVRGNYAIARPAHKYHKWKWRSCDYEVFAFIVLGLLLFDVAVAPQMAYNLQNHTMVLVMMLLAGATFWSFVLWQHGWTAAEAWGTGYELELAQSVSNYFGIHVVYKAFNIPDRHSTRVMTYGIYLAMFFRLLFFVNIRKFGALNYPTDVIIGCLLIAMAVGSFYEEKDEGENRPAVKFCKWFFGHRLQETYNDEGTFFVRTDDGKYQVTMLLLVVSVIGCVDIVFSLDNVATMQFELNTSVGLMTTSCIMAMFLLRQLFFIILDISEYFEYAQYAVAAVLVFCAFQMFAYKWIRLPMIVPFITIFLICALALAASLIKMANKGTDTRDTGTSPQSDTETSHEASRENPQVQGNPQDDKSIAEDDTSDDLQTKFDKAANLILKGKPKKNAASNSDKLALYGLYKQAKDGENNQNAPWAVQLEARAKWDAWSAQKGKSKTQAMEDYVAEVERQRKEFQIELPFDS